MNIVCVGAHQDDIETKCLGTLLKYVDRGDVTITNVSVSDGSNGAIHDPSISHSEMAAIRNKEASEIAKALGGRFICMGEADGFVHDTDEARTKLTDILREAKADVVLADPPIDYNMDHMITSLIAFHACNLTTIRCFFTDHDPLTKFPALYYYDAVAGLDWQPTHYVDISSVAERKFELLKLFESQNAAMKVFSGYNLIESSKIQSAFRGMQCGVEYAEAFKPALAALRLRPGNIFP